jgi:hypothetical protein
LLGFVWLLDFAESLEHADVTAELGGTRGDTGDDGENAGIQFPGVRLAGHRKRSREPHFSGDGLIEKAHLLVVAIEQIEKARLRASRSFHATEGKRPHPILEIPEIENKILHPQGRALADRGRLRRLKMRVSQGWLVTPFFGERGEGSEDIADASAQETERASHQDQIGVVRDIGAGRSEVNEALGCWRGIGECMNVGHHVVTEPLLISGDRLEVDLVQRPAHLRDGGFGNLDAELLLSFRQRQPETAPQAMAHSG